MRLLELLPPRWLLSPIDMMEGPFNHRPSPTLPCRPPPSKTRPPNSEPLLERADPDPRRRHGHEDPGLPRSSTRPQSAATASPITTARPQELRRHPLPHPPRRHHGEIHRRYLEAGADIIETNTFGASPVGMEEFGLPRRPGPRDQRRRGRMCSPRGRRDEPSEDARQAAVRRRFDRPDDEADGDFSTKVDDPP